MAQKAPQPTKDEVVSAYRRDQILTAAHTVFASRGFRQATVGDIADAAGIAKGTLLPLLQVKGRHLLGGDESRPRRPAGADHGQPWNASTIRARSFARSIETKVRFFDADRDFFSIYFAEFGNVSPHHLPAQQPFLPPLHGTGRAARSPPCRRRPGQAWFDSRH